MARKQAEEALANALQADKAKAADLRTAYQQHQDEVHRIKRDCEKDIRRLVRTHKAGSHDTVYPHFQMTDNQQKKYFLKDIYQNPLNCQAKMN